MINRNDDRASQMAIAPAATTAIAVVALRLFGEVKPADGHLAAILAQQQQTGASRRSRASAMPPYEEDPEGRRLPMFGTELRQRRRSRVLGDR